MVEFHRYPLRVQQSKLDRLKVTAGNFFRARGEAVTDIEISPSEIPALRVFH